MRDRCEMCGAEHQALREQESNGHEKRGLRIVEVRDGMCGPCREADDEDMRLMMAIAERQAQYFEEACDGQ